MKITPLQLFGGGLIVFTLATFLSVLIWGIIGGMRLGIPFDFYHSYVMAGNVGGGFNLFNLVLDFAFGVLLAFGYFAVRGDKA